MDSHVPSEEVDASGLFRELAVFSGRLDSAAFAATRRKWVTAVVLGATLAGIGGYLAWLHGTIREFAEPNTLVELASAAIEPRLEEEVGLVGERLVAEAPALLDQAETMVLDAPPKIVAAAGEFLAARFDDQLSSLEERVYELVSGMLRESLDRARAGGIDLDDDAEVEALVDRAAPLMRSELKKAVDEIYAEYLRSAEGIGATVDRLAGAGPLDETERRQREILVTGLALIRKLEADPSRAPVQGVIGGSAPESR